MPVRNRIAEMQPEIAAWRRGEAERLTRERRPDLLAGPQPVTK